MFFLHDSFWTLRSRWVPCKHILLLNYWQCLSCLEIWTNESTAFNPYVWSRVCFVILYWKDRRRTEGQQNKLLSFLNDLEVLFCSCGTAHSLSSFGFLSFKCSEMFVYFDIHYLLFNSPINTYVINVQFLIHHEQWLSFGHYRICDWMQGSNLHRSHSISLKNMHWQKKILWIVCELNLNKSSCLDFRWWCTC